MHINRIKNVPFRLFASFPFTVSSPSVRDELGRFLPIFFAISISLGLDLLPAIQFPSSSPFNKEMLEIYQL